MRTSFDCPIRFCTSTCFSLRSYSARIFCFSASTIRSFSMLNSSSVFSLISAAFSRASWWMSWTICGGEKRENKKGRSE